MKKSILVLSAIAAVASMASADIKVNVNPALGVRGFDVEYGYLKDMSQKPAEGKEPFRLSATSESGNFTIPTLADDAAQYVIPVNQGDYIVLFTQPGDELTVDIQNFSPLSYTVKGTQLMEDIARLDSESSVFLEQYHKMRSSGQPDPEALKQIGEAYDKLFTDYIADNPESAAVPYAIMHLDGADFMNAYEGMTPKAAASPLAMLLEPQKERVGRQMAAQQRKQALQSGDAMAPDFTFKNAEGKEVSLSDFRGKWVIIDFWGTWCPWCIKGFPELKEAYAKYAPQLEIVGVACNDEYDAWLNGLKKYDLPWVNFYNPEPKGGKLLEDYGVEGFPTKAIVNPEGKIVNITTGHNPEFFNILKEKIGK